MLLQRRLQQGFIGLLLALLCGLLWPLLLLRLRRHARQLLHALLL